MFHDVLLFERFHKNIPSRLLFSSKSAQTFSRQNVPVRNIALSQRPGVQYAFFSLSVRHA